VWEGVLHVAPAPHDRHADLQAQLLVLLAPPAKAAGLKPIGDFNLGEPEDYRVPDAGLRRRRPGQLYNPTAALVVEILVPGDKTWDKLSFYAAHGVDELLIVDPDKRSVDWLALLEGECRAVEDSKLIELGAAELAERIDWPPPDEDATT
jgi:Uma2 family endonuclease